MNMQTTPQQKSRVFLNPDGYIELIFHGVVYHDTLRQLIDGSTALAAVHGPINALIDGRFGAVDRKAKTFRVMMSMGRISGMKNVIILTSNDSQAIHAIHGPSIVTSILSSALGFKPAYIDDEAEARAMAASK